MNNPRDLFHFKRSLQGNRGKVECFEGRRGKDKPGVEPLTTRVLALVVRLMLPMPMLGGSTFDRWG